MIVVAATDPGRIEEAANELCKLAQEHPLALGGAGVGPDLAQRLGAQLLSKSPAGAAESLDSAFRVR
jgi:hypothetical protein